MNQIYKKKKLYLSIKIGQQLWKIKLLKMLKKLYVRVVDIIRAKKKSDIHYSWAEFNKCTRGDSDEDNTHLIDAVY